MAPYTIHLTTGGVLEGHITADTQEQRDAFVHALTTPYDAPIVFGDDDGTIMCVMPRSIAAFSVGPTEM